MAGTHRLQVAGGGPPTSFLDLRQAAAPTTVAVTSSYAKFKKSPLQARCSATGCKEPVTP